MKVKELMKFLKRFKQADLLIEGKPINFEAYEDQSGKLIINLKPSTKDEKSLDKAK